MERALALRPLPTIATEIRQDIEAADKHWQSAVKHAIRAGEGLIEAKGLLEHGQWLPWLEENFQGFSARMAQNYMRLARNRNAVSHLPTIREAVAELAAPKTESDGTDETVGETIPETAEEVRDAVFQGTLELLTKEQTMEVAKRIVAMRWPEPHKSEFMAGWDKEDVDRIQRARVSLEAAELWRLQGGRVLLGLAGDLECPIAVRAASAKLASFFLAGDEVSPWGEDEEWDTAYDEWEAAVEEVS